MVGNARRSTGRPRVPWFRKVLIGPDGQVKGFGRVLRFVPTVAVVANPVGAVLAAVGLLVLAHVRRR